MKSNLHGFVADSPWNPNELWGPVFHLADYQLISQNEMIVSLTKSIESIKTAINRRRIASWVPMNDSKSKLWTPFVFEKYSTRSLEKVWKPACRMNRISLLLVLMFYLNSGAASTLENLCEDSKFTYKGLYEVNSLRRVQFNKTLLQVDKQVKRFLFDKKLWF